MSAESFNPEAAFFGIEEAQDYLDLRRGFQYTDEFNPSVREESALKGEIFADCAKILADHAPNRLPELIQNLDSQAYARFKITGRESDIDNPFPNTEAILTIFSSAAWVYREAAPKIDKITLDIMEDDDESHILVRMFQLNDDGRLIYNISVANECERLNRLAEAEINQTYNDLLDRSTEREVKNVPSTHYDSLGQMREMHTYIKLIKAVA